MICVKLKGRKGVLGDGPPKFSIDEIGYWDLGKWMNGNVVFWITEWTGGEEVSVVVTDERRVHDLREILPSAQWLGNSKIAVSETDYMMLMLASDR